MKNKEIDSKYSNYNYTENISKSIDKIYPTVNESMYNYFQGKTVDVEIQKNDSDIRLDLEVKRKISFKLWGQVKDSQGKFVEDAFVILLKPKYIRGEIEYIPISTTVSDSIGFYQFDIEKLEKGLKYKVSVSK